jgi:hypothetical protein
MKDAVATCKKELAARKLVHRMSWPSLESCGKDLDVILVPRANLTSLGDRTMAEARDRRDIRAGWTMSDRVEPLLRISLRFEAWREWATVTLPALLRPDDSHFSSYLFRASIGHTSKLTAPSAQLATIEQSLSFFVDCRWS